jgi:radical SAM superfamily enzyme YgiQ (UPF0313 family)
MNINYMPMGLLALAHHLNRSGHPCQVVHAGIEKILDPAFAAANLVRDLDVAAVGLPLHWHYQAYDVAQAAARIKAARPDLFVFLGGITASYFGLAALEAIPAADAVVVGEGFEPTRLLLDALDHGRDLAHVPNLAWRGPHGTLRNPATLLHPQAFVDSLVYADFTPLRHHEAYVAQFGFPLAYSWELSPEENRKLMTMGRSFFPLFVGSGCPRSCTYCCGNAKTQARINHGHRILWRSQDAVLEDVRAALAAGYRTMALCFDPMPESTPYFVELFRRMKRETPAADLYFEAWSLPDPAFIDAFADAFEPPHSYLALSPDTGDEALRKANKGYHYSNAQLLETADLLLRKGIQMDVFFSIGFPRETAALALGTRDLMRRMADTYRNIRRLMVWAVQIEPGSPMFEDPSRFGIVSNRRTLSDYIRVHGAGADAYTALGYRIPGFFGDARDRPVTRPAADPGSIASAIGWIDPADPAAEAERDAIAAFERDIQQFKCMEFCFHAKDPRVYNNPVLGRQACLDKRRLLAQRRQAALPDRPISDDCSWADALERERPAGPRIEI